MLETQTPSIFESFNARSLAPQQVAQTFVPSNHFKILCKRAHSLVIGPRGSGKTTLLKMLHPVALSSWQHEDAETYRNKIDYTAVFIATDRSWHSQLKLPGALGEVERQVLGRAAFTTHVLKALVSTFEARISSLAPNAHFSAQLSEESERHLVESLRDPWHIAPRINTLSSLRVALTSRLSQIREAAGYLAREGSGESQTILNGLGFVDLYFLDAAAIAVELFDDALGAPYARWALCFDELELAPPWVTDELVSSIRSINEKFLFKLAISPYSGGSLSVGSAFDAMPRQDYDEIELWYAHKEDGYEFCEQLLQGMLREKGLNPNLPAKQVFGTSLFDTERSEWVSSGTAYNKSSRLYNRLISLRSKDPAFRTYLSENGIKLERLGEISADERAAVIRKVASLVAVRNEFLTDGKGNGSQSGRSRKNPQLYTGASSIFAVSEGNPRWFIAMVGAVLSVKSSGKVHVSRAHQATEVTEAANRFRSLLRTIPIKSTNPPTDRGILGLLDRIGRELQREILGDKFDPDYVGSFTVDSNVSDEVLNALGQALNAGAIVYVPDPTGTSMVTSVKGKRFRLTYLLAPHYKLPLTLGRSLSLSRLLVKGTETLAKSAKDQRSLFGEKK